MSYRPISDYAIIGNLHTAALVSTAGSIDWACLPHFDSPALFLRLLDDARGGYCAIHPAGTESSTRRYLDETNILETTFRTATGILRVTDFMPVRKSPEATDKDGKHVDEHTIVRQLRCMAGRVDFGLEIRPTFGFATEPAALECPPHGPAVFKGSKHALHAHGPFTFQQRNGGVLASTALRESEECSLVLAYVTADQLPPRHSPEAITTAFRQTHDFWRDWSSRCLYEGEHREAVLRSALVLKMLTFAPTGAIIAAPTTSLPEEIGGIRNWDYRFTWLRDATFTLVALMNLGYFDEAHQFLNFLERACSCPIDQLQILYGIHGERQEEEQILTHLHGYRGSQPVRVGNAAAEQKQFDVYGELLDSIYLFIQLGGLDRYRESFEDVWPLVERIADYVADHWREPDSGIWEVRSKVRHFVHSKAMCWVALDHAIRLAAWGQVERDVSRWQREREELYQEMLTHGYNRQVGAFVAAYGSTALDAAVLRLPMLGVIRADDPRMRSTVEQIERQLGDKGLIFRYRGLDDGLPGTEGAFAICSFWLIHNYVLQGRLPEAEEQFRRMLAHANDVGLYAEQVDPATGEHLGNFPQAFTHIALINAAIRITAAREGKHFMGQSLVESHEPESGERKTALRTSV